MQGVYIQGGNIDVHQDGHSRQELKGYFTPRIRYKEVLRKELIIKCKDVLIYTRD